MFKRILEASRTDAGGSGEEHGRSKEETFPDRLAVWAVVLGVVGIILVSSVISSASSDGARKGKARSGTLFQPTFSTSFLYDRANFTGTTWATQGTPAPQATSGPPDERVTESGLGYQTCIARPTKKGYYLPKVIPYPVGKPVYVNGYYRRDGTYAQPHFRALPRRR